MERQTEREALESNVAGQKQFPTTVLTANTFPPSTTFWVAKLLRPVHATKFSTNPQAPFFRQGPGSTKRMKEKRLTGLVGEGSTENLHRNTTRETQPGASTNTI